VEEILIFLSKYFYPRPVDFRKILEEIGAEKAMEAPKDAFFKIGISGKALERFLEERKLWSPSLMGKTGGEIKILTIFDADYPVALKNIYDAPPVLFYRGDLSVLKNFSLAVVGSRKTSEYGRRAAEFFTRGVVPHFTVVSGLAYGIDSLAHIAALSSGGKAIAVLGSGLDEESIYPKINIDLARNIVSAGGLLLSEVPLGTGPLQFHFPMRNRIIAGLSRGILIVEGGEKSGTLITAKLGLDYGVDIFAIPGNIFSENSAGVNYLLKCGAHPVTEAKDILEFYGIEALAAEKLYEPKNEIEKIIMKNIGGEPKQADELARLAKAPVSDIMMALTEMEMAGAIKNIGGKYVKV
jgi:DNA processing protein